MSAAHLLLNHQMRQFESSMDMALGRASRSKGIMDLVRAFHSRPHAPSYLKCLGAVRSSEGRFKAMAERIGESLVKDRLEALEQLVGHPEYCHARRAFKVDMCCLTPHIPRLHRVVEQRLSAMDARIRAQDLPAREQQRERG